MALFQGNKGQILRGTKTILENREHKKTTYRFLGNMLLFHKIHSGAVSIEKDKYLAPAHSLKSTRASRCAQYCRYQTYSDAVKNSFFPELFHSGMVFPLRWSIPRLLRSLGHSLFSQNTAKRFFFFKIPNSHSLT